MVKRYCTVMVRLSDRWWKYSTEKGSWTSCDLEDKRGVYAEIEFWESIEWRLIKWVVIDAESKSN